MTYKQANVSKKCKEAYKKRKTSPKKMSPRRRKTSPRNKGSRRRMNNFEDSFKTYEKATNEDNWQKIGRSEFVTFEDLTDRVRPTYTVISKHDTPEEAREEADRLNARNENENNRNLIYNYNTFASDTPIGSVIVDHWDDL